MTTTEQPKKKSKINWKNTITLIISLIVMVAIGFVVKYDFGSIKTFITKAGVWGILISIILYASLGATFVPSEPLTLLITAIFGPWVALVTSWVGNTLSAIVEYYIGKHIGNAANFLEKKDKLPFGLSKLRIDSPWFLIGGRIIPLYGAKAISVVAGAYHVPLYRYLWTTAVTILIGSAMFSFGGFGIFSLFK
jgi:uncharacterized membrane protein YdjX (TVP38/TMEM64 family)